MLARALLALLLTAGAAAAQTAPPPAREPIGTVRIPAPGGEVIISSRGEQRAYEEIKFAPARRVGETLYISGVIAFRAPGDGADAEGLKNSVRRAFRQIDRTLKAAGGSFADVVMINSHHVWTGPNFTGTREEHFRAFSAVKDEFMSEPHPAWTAVGTTELLSDTGQVEIQMIAHLPRRPAPAR